MPCCTPARATDGCARLATDVPRRRGAAPASVAAGAADPPSNQRGNARSHVYAAVDEAWTFVQGGERLTAREGLPLALAAAHGMETAVRAVELVHSLAGTTAIRNDRRFQQHFRDVHTISQHAFASPSRFQSAGKLLLGRESDRALSYV